MATQHKGGGITWTEETWNPIRGCSKVSEGCRNCYAMHVAARFSGPGMPYEGLALQRPARWTGQVRFLDHAAGDPLTKPLRWTRPRRVFVNSMSDLFHDGLADEQIDQVLAVMALAPQHTFQVLTKRPDRMRAYMAGLVGSGAGWSGLPSRICDAAVKAMQPKDIRRLSWDLPAWPLSNVWWGVSAEDQATADSRIPVLLATSAAVRWVSLEPLLGAVNVRPYLTGWEDHGTPFSGARTVGGCVKWTPPLDWVVVGGESAQPGADARPMHPDWCRDIREACLEAGVPFHFKQWGDWVPDELLDHGTARGLFMRADGRRLTLDDDLTDAMQDPTFQHFSSVGKKTAGRTLDGRTWDEFPGKVAA